MRAETAADIGPEDTVAVIGASGNVGRLVALRLADMGACKVRAVARNPERAAAFFGDLESEVEVVAADTTKPGPELLAAVDGCAGLVVCTGTTAFPTLAWRGGNTPDAVDRRGVKNVLEAWEAAAEKAQGGRAKRLVLMSSIGVQRRDQMPFPVLNACGVLDAKADGEQAVRDACGGWLEGYSIVRPGQLSGGPYDNNYYLGTLAKLDRPARSVLLWDDSPKNAIEMSGGDELLGDTLRSTVADALVRSLLAPNDGSSSTDFAVINVDGPRPSEEELAAQFVACA